MHGEISFRNKGAFLALILFPYHSPFHAGMDLERKMASTSRNG
jgi:hypothetical protein